MQLYLCRKRNPSPSAQSTLKASGRFDLLPEVSTLSIQKKKLSPRAWLVDLLWPWAFHQLLEYFVIITCTLSAFSPGLCPGRTIHHNNIILYHLLLGGMRLIELILPLTGADRNGGLQMGSAERWCSASASSAFSRQNLRPLRCELDLCSPPAAAQGSELTPSTSQVGFLISCPLQPKRLVDTELVLGMHGRKLLIV